MDETMAAALGWTWIIDGEDGFAYRDGEERLQVTSQSPVYTILCQIAEIEKQPPPPLPVELAPPVAPPAL